MFVNRERLYAHPVEWVPDNGDTNVHLIPCALNAHKRFLWDQKFCGEKRHVEFSSKCGICEL